MTHDTNVPDLTSTRNERVRSVASLHRRKGRRASGTFLVEGQHPVAEALADGWVTEVFCLPELAEDWDVAPRVTTVDERVLAAMSDAVTPQGVVAVASIPDVSLAQVVGTGVLVVLVEASDPGNVGTIIRTADAMGAAGVVLTSGSVDPFSPKVVRSCAGSLTHLPVIPDVGVGDLWAACRGAGQRLVGLDGYATASLYDDDVLRAPVALVFGSEAHGLPDDVTAELDTSVAVPVYGRAESLNLAVAAAITLHEAARVAHGR